MMVFSEDPQIAENQMHAIIFYLTAFGYIDGDFAPTEKTFVREFIKKLIQMRVHSALHDADPSMRADLIEEYSGHFLEVFDKIDGGVKSLFTEAVSNDEDVQGFVYQKLKLRAFEIFKTFDEENQRQLLETVHELIMADGVAHPNELVFRDEVIALLKTDIPLSESDIETMEPAQLEVAAPQKSQKPRVDNHPLFERVERHYSSNPELLKQQAAADYKLIEATMMTWDDQRKGSDGKLNNHQSIADFAGQKPFLDGHVYVHPTQPGKDYELTVLGDLHGCYSCLKAAVLQSDFFNKVTAWRANPDASPKPMMVLLGDYIDRGIFSYNGILRTVMQLFVTAPDHVYVLRGNHEYYLEYKGKIFGGVKPAEAINTLESYMPIEMFKAYMKCFEAMPNMLLFDQFMFVHAGIPRDEAIKEKYQDLGSLNDPDLRFQMMWSDPAEADFIPVELQKGSRFPFGRLQFRSFMARIGATTLVRGHEKIDEGFKKIYDDGVVVLLNLFSAGGKHNNDLPANSNYRNVTPMALTITSRDGKHTATPWVIDWARYNDPALNAFFQSRPEIQFKAD
jgi:hypothetical protein